MTRRSSHPNPGNWKEENIFLFILLGGFLHGLLYILLINPWGHYDEPMHFEYAWLIANRTNWPERGDYDLPMREQLLQSMKRAYFYNEILRPPNEKDLSQPLALGYSQVGDPPLYYLLASLPLRLLRAQALEIQLHSGRLVSIFFLLVTISCGYILAREITTPGSHLRWMLPAFIALLPSFVAFMTSFNNHPMAIGLVSLWILLSIRLIRRGFSFVEFSCLLAITILCLFTQKTSWIVILLLPVVLALTFVRQKRWIIPLGLLVVIALIIAVSIDFADGTFWIRRNFQQIPARGDGHPNIKLDHAAQVDVIPETASEGELTGWDLGLYQLIPPGISQTLRGKPATLGAWIWSDQPARIYGPGINALCGNHDHFQGFPTIEVGPTPVFIAAHLNLPDENCRIQVWLRGMSPEGSSALVHYGGIVFAEGHRSLDQIPIFTDQSGKSGNWQWPFTNLVRNPTFTNSWPSLRYGFYRLIQPLYELNPSSFQSALSLIWDFPGSAWYTLTTSRVLFETFWAKFGWGQISLLTVPGLIGHPHRILALVTIVALIGFCAWLARFRRQAPWAEIVFLMMVIAVVSIFTFVYGTITMGGALRFRAYYPTARYLFPAILPISLLLNTGWLEISVWPRKWIKYPRKLGAIFFLSFFMILDLYALASVYWYFHIA